MRISMDCFDCISGEVLLWKKAKQRNESEFKVPTQRYALLSSRLVWSSTDSRTRVARHLYSICTETARSRSNGIEGSCRRSRQVGGALMHNRSPLWKGLFATSGPVLTNRANLAIRFRLSDLPSLCRCGTYHDNALSHARRVHSRDEVECCREARRCPANHPSHAQPPQADLAPNSVAFHGIAASATQQPHFSAWINAEGVHMRDAGDRLSSATLSSMFACSEG
jgi:hypothetical protein